MFSGARASERASEIYRFFFYPGLRGSWHRSGADTEATDNVTVVSF